MMRRTAMCGGKVPQGALPPLFPGISLFHEKHQAFEIFPFGMESQQGLLLAGFQGQGFIGEGHGLTC